MKNDWSGPNRRRSRVLAIGVAAAGFAVMPSVLPAQNVESVPEMLARHDASLKGLAPFFGKSTNGEVLRLRNTDGKEIAYLGVSGVGNGLLVVHDAAGAERVKVFVNETGGFISLNDKNGEVASQLGAAASGNGFIYVKGKSLDVAEAFELATRAEVEPGTVMAVADTGKVRLSRRAYDPAVVGVVSGAGGLSPGMTLGSREDGSNDLPIAIAGQVYVRVNGEGGPIQPGDLLVASSRPGVAMRVRDRRRAFGAVLGKALEPHAGDASEGLVRALVTVR